MKRAPSRLSPARRRVSLLWAALLWAPVACSAPPAAEPEAPPPATAATPAATPAVAAPPAATPAATPGPYRAPQPHPDPAAAGIGARLPLDLVWRDVSGDGQGTLGSLVEGAPAVVIVLTSLRCPLTRLYAAHLRERLEPALAKGVRVLVLDSLPQDGESDLRELAAGQGWTWPVARDPEGRWTRALRAERTTDVFLVDSAGALRYRGALDDQYGLGYRLPAPRQRLLLEALEAVLAGREPACPATLAPGCLLPAPPG